MNKEYVKVWAGVWSGSVPTPDELHRNKRWDKCTLLETKGLYVYVSGPGGTRWVYPEGWRHVQY